MEKVVHAILAYVLWTDYCVESIVVIVNQNYNYNYYK